MQESQAALSHEELFFKPGVSPTSINQFYESPSRFWRYSSLNPNKERKEPTPAMIFGRLVHCLILTPDNFDKEFAVLPVKGKDDVDTMDEMKAFIAPRINGDQKIPSKANKSDLVNIIRQIAPEFMVWSDKIDLFNKTLGRKTAVTPDQFGIATQMKDAMFANAAVRSLIGNGASESPICWFDEGSPIMKKAKLDYDRNRLVIEYKTTVGPNEDDFARTIAQNGYHRQVAMQIEAAHSIGEDPMGGVVIAQDKDQFDDIAIYALDQAAIATGHAENARAFADITRRYRAHNSGDGKAWRSFPEEIKAISLPRWYQAKA